MNQVWEAGDAIPGGARRGSQTETHGAMRWENW